jgi:hypothetical protein
MNQTPDLDPWDTADLVPHSHGWRDLPSHGEPLDEVIARSSGRDWLEGCVVAGYVPHPEGLLVALRALHLFYRAQITENEAEDVAGDAIAWADDGATRYREMITFLEDCVVEMERVFSELYRRLVHDDVADEARIATMWHEDAQSAEGRARRARARRDEAVADNRDAERLRRRYTEPDQRKTG